MVSVSPRAEFLDSDEDWDVANNDPRFEFGFRSMTLEGSGYSDHEFVDDQPAFAGTSHTSATRRRRQQRHDSEVLSDAAPFKYYTRADGEAFRLVVMHPGTGSSTVQCDLVWASTKDLKQVKYTCLSYAWGSLSRGAAILVDGFRYPVTTNLLAALRCLRKPRSNVTIWIDQICINQDDPEERAHQVSIMKKIFNQAYKVYVWLGEADDRSERLCEYAKSMRRGSDEGTKTTLHRILTQRELRDAIQKLLERPWFQRVWVIQEVALARMIDVVCGRGKVTWPELVRLIRDVKIPLNPGFDKHGSLLGNPRQRTAILTQLIASQKESRAHTDVTQLLILSKSSQATDSRDKIYAFYGLTLLTTVADYTIPNDPSSIEYRRYLRRLYIDVAEQYVNAIQWEASYASWHRLTEEQRTFQLMSIVYSAGKLHHHLELPSWVPDWTFAWHLAPVWCHSTPNFAPAVAKNDWSVGIRSVNRAGGRVLRTFEVTRHQLNLRISAILVDTIILVNEITPVPTPSDSQILESLVSDTGDDTSMRTLQYGRHFFATTDGYVGFATPGIEEGDVIAVIVGGDVPVVLRPTEPDRNGKSPHYHLLCECYLQSPSVMNGDFLKDRSKQIGDITLM